MRSISTRTTGLLLVALGVWGGVVPFVGHYFHFALGPDKAWTWTTGRLYLDVLPAVATVLGGLILMRAGPRGSARLGALLALAGGIWFAIGPEISQLWHTGGAQGAGHGSARIQMLEMLTYHTGLGVIVAALAGYAFPRFPVVERRQAAAQGPGRAAAAGAGAGAVPMAGREDRRVDDEPGQPVTDREAAQADADTRQRHLGRDAAIGAGAAGAVAAEHRRREHLAEEQTAAREPVAERDVAGASDQSGGARDMTSTAEQPVAADTGPATATGTTRSGDSSGHSMTMRRRRGGLLGSLLRR